MNNRIIFPIAKKPFFGVKILKFFDADPGSGMGNSRIPDPGSGKTSRIRNTVYLTQWKSWAA
jgi:hypothetical protein